MGKQNLYFNPNKKNNTYPLYTPVLLCESWVPTLCPEVIKLISCSAQLSIIIKLLMNTEIAKINGNYRFKSPKPVINVKITIVGIFTFISRINFMLS